MLARYACRSSESAGRHFTEEEHPDRSCFQRDRDRILHSRCFRRLEYKTQVFVNGMDDHYRTRMTHTMEMTAVARTLARAFRVNEDLAECIALAHDIGHTPFGHSGESELDKLMTEYGGFDHNEQSLRWVDLLEVQYPGFPGLNLSWEVRAGLMKHASKKEGSELDGIPTGPFQSAEAQIADVADDMTYLAHDTDDALEAGLLTLERLEDQALWRMARAAAREQYPGISGEQEVRISIRNVLNLQVRDVIRTGMENLAQFNPKSLQGVMRAPCRLICFSEEMQAMAGAFRDFLYSEVYWNPAVRDLNDASVRMMSALFGHYLDNPQDMGRKARVRIESEGLERTVCDYVSGFTDRYALEEHRRYGL